MRAVVLRLLTLVGIGLELLLRVASPFPSYRSQAIGAYPDQYDAHLGWAGVPNLRREFILPEFSTVIENNALGFRDRDFERKLEESAQHGSQRALLLGDSFAWGWGIDADERAGELLEVATGTLTTFNLAQCGYGTDQQLLVFDALKDRLQPDLVLVLLYRNDFGDVANATRYGDQAKPVFESRDGRLELGNVPVPFDEDFWRLKTQLSQRFGVREFEDYEGPGAAPDGSSTTVPPRALTDRSHAINWLRFRLGQLRTWLGDRSDSDDLTPRRLRGLVAQRARLVEISELLFEILGAIEARADALGARTLVVLIPTKAQVIGGGIEVDWQSLLLAGCRERGIACLDLLPDFGGRNELYWRVDPHWNPAGNRAAAEVIQRDLLARGWIDPPQGRD
jgi:hypothetical protein